MENNSAMFVSVLSEVERPLVSTLLFIIAVVGIVGNILVILAFGLSRKLQNTTNCFVVNLSVADLITCLSIPINAVAMASPTELIPDWICIICGFCSVTCIGCGVYNLTCIAVYRLVLVSNRQPHTGNIFTPFVVSIIIGITWLIPLTMASIPLVFGFGELGYNQKYSSCTWKTASDSSELDSYSLLLAVTYYPIPTVIIIASYIKLFIHLKGHRKRVIPLQRSQEECSQPVQPAQRGARKSSQKVVTKNMFYVVCTFLVCMTPYSVALVVSESDFFVPYAVVFLLASSCANPIIYATKHPHFSIVMRSIITCGFKKIPHFVFR